MKRSARFIIWLVGGCVGTLCVPLALTGLLYVAGDTFLAYPLKVLAGLSIYILVPLGFLFSLFMAVSSLRWKIDGVEEPIQPPVPTRGNGS